MLVFQTKINKLIIYQDLFNLLLKSIIRVQMLPSGPNKILILQEVFKLVI
jgi:hypothetical protein